MPVFNEEKLMPSVLPNILPHVDELVIVDGGPQGPSTDRTSEIIRDTGGEKVVYRSGKYVLPDGAWDCATQKNTGLSLCSGDIVLLLSADMLFYNLEFLAEILRTNESHKLFFVPTMEFWLDTSSIRLYSPDGDYLTVPSQILQPVAFSKTIRPVYQTDAALRIQEIRLDQRLLVPSTTKYHLGWIRSFPQQVAKHICHVQQHRWGDHGENLLRGEKRDLELWAILHVLSYRSIPHVPIQCNLPKEMESLMDMKFNDGSERVMQDFEQEYGISVLKLRSKQEVSDKKVRVVNI
jgi:hypothetical protein